MKGSNKIIDKYRAIAEELLVKNKSNHFVYHTIDHTRGVVNSFLEIGEASNLSSKELVYGELAAWFHDTGYMNDVKAHEAASVELFMANVDKNDFNEDEIRIISDLILATKMPQNPKTDVEKVLCDADVHHIGTNQFLATSALLKEELENVYGMPISKDTWRLENYNFLLSHKFHTTYASEKYESKKIENIELIKSGVKEFAKRDKQIKKLESQIDKLNEKLQKPSRGIETMFRLTSRNHLELSSMADSKANIMISVNTIVISIIVTFSSGRIADYPYLLPPLSFLILVCLTTIVLAILATRPKVSKGTFTKEDIANKKTNLLFFGNFHGMKLEEYQWGVNEMLNDSEYLYNSLSRDIFFLGKVLGRKYRILRAAYTTFMWGFVVSILLIVIVGWINNIN